MTSETRVFITGVGIICSIGNNFQEFSTALKKGENGADIITAFNPQGYRGMKGCEVKRFDPAAHFDKRELRRMDRSSQFCLTAAREAVLSSRINLKDLRKERCAISLGSTLGGMISGTEYFRRLKKNRAYASLLLDYPLYSAGSRISIEYGFMGPNTIISTACSSANVAMGYAYDLIQSNMADIVIAGGFDTMAEITCSGFGVLRNVSKDVCRPFDQNRNGLILGEGAACLIFENADHCRARGGKPLAEFLGYGMSSDAYHMTAPDNTGRGPARSMQKAIDNSRVRVEDIDYINAHGTGTLHNDQIETVAIKKVFGEHASRVPISSTKSLYGHTLGAAGAIEAVTVVAAMQGGVIPPTINYQTADPKCDLDYVPNKAREREITISLSNNFGFGGNNCSVVLRNVKNSSS